MNEQPIVVTRAEMWQLLEEHLGTLQNPGDLKDDVAKEYERFVDMLDEMESGMSGTVMSALGDLEYTNQRRGEVLDDPVSGILDGSGFAYVDDHHRGTSIEVNIGLDCTGSMKTCLGLSWTRGKREINATGKKFPLFVAPRMFFGSLICRYIYKSLVSAQAKSGVGLKVRAFCWGEDPPTFPKEGNQVSLYLGQVWIRHPAFGSQTHPYYFFRRVREAEIVDGQQDAHKLDLLITDGSFDSGVLRKKADEIQEERGSAGGSLQTIVLQLAPEGSVSMNWIPSHSKQFRVSSPQILAQVMDRFIKEHIYKVAYS